MKLYIKQKVLCWGDKFTVKDETGQDRYYVEGEIFTFGKKLHIYDVLNREVAFIQQKMFSFLPKYYVFVGDNQVAEIIKKFSFTPNYVINGPNWEVAGNFIAHDYEITENGYVIASIHKQWLTWGDCYELDIPSTANEVLALSVVLAIDCVMATNTSAASC